MLKTLHASWVTGAQGKVGDEVVEVSPLVSYAGEELEVYCKDKSFDKATTIEK